MSTIIGLVSTFRLPLQTYTTKRSKPSSYISPQNRTTAPNHHENIQNPIILSKSVDLPLPQESLLLHSRNKKNNPLPKRILPDT